MEVWFSFWQKMAPRNMFLLLVPYEYFDHMTDKFQSDVRLVLFVSVFVKMLISIVAVYLLSVTSFIINYIWDVFGVFWKMIFWRAEA